ncbi:MAG: hypothetical protein OEZ58_05500 [Gammaproteobacteria bacterium]|nr:hypothetical protein [Gammaproteobacteria bacterium]MDH5728421.1 hypothetical protein [Gammaproteobacteria bacterium]
MTKSEKEFRIVLYQEHITEIGVLLEDRDSYFSDSSISWLDVSELEQRIEAHWDAMMIGQDLAKSIAIELLSSGIDEELSGACYCLALGSREDEDELVIIEKLGQADDDQIEYFRNALKHSISMSLAGKLVALLGEKKLPLKIVVLDILGYACKGDPKRIWPLLHESDLEVRQATSIAISRYAHKETLTALEPIVLSDEGSSKELLFSGIWLGSIQALDMLRSNSVNPQYCPENYLHLLALVGSEQDFPVITTATMKPEKKLEAINAMGVVGMIAGIEPLLNELNCDDELVRCAAAQALHLMSGAGLLENVVQVENDDEEIDPESILSGIDPTEQDKMPSLQEAEIQIERLCTQHDVWEAWWQENKNKFDNNIRYRYGQPWSLGLCIEEIAHPHSTMGNRQRAYWEFTIRSGVHIPFEPDWFIDKQLDAIAKMRAWWQQNQEVYSGQWMFHGK